MRILRSSRLLLVLALAACDPEPVQWGDAARIVPAEVARAGPAWGLTLNAQGDAVPERAVALAWAPAGACGGSVAFAHERGGEWHAVWWHTRADSSAELEAARSHDSGATWSAPMAVDSSDRGRRGCARPAPAIAADSTTGYVHVAYYLEPAGDGAVWLVHSMDRGASWHPPVALAYGADPAVASVAASGDTVVVAYESPNANEGWVDLAISTSAGHAIDRRLVAVSGRSVATQAPRVALRGRSLAVAWITTIGALAMARAGSLR